ncbi:unnamed protein product, partial [marine sediment metagenome]
STGYKGKLALYNWSKVKLRFEEKMVVCIWMSG